MTLSKLSKKLFYKRPVVVLSGVLFVALAFSVGFFVGHSNGTRSVVPAGEGVVINQGSVTKAEKVDFRNYWDIWNFIKDEYYKQPVSDTDLYFSSIKGLVAGLEDPYSVYFDPKEAERFNSNIEGSFEGIGAEIGIKDEKLTIVAPLDSSPAKAAGTMPGDWIVLIDETETLGMTIEEAVDLIRGEGGTQVVLTVKREGEDALLELPITRAKIVIDSVKWELTDDNIIQISVSTFNSETSKLFQEAVQEALEKNVKGIILDLRSNPGGLLNSAIDIASAWVGYEPVVIEKAKEKTKTFRGVIAPRLSGIKTIVLVNAGSASGSEIVAGALQDYKHATLVGTKTYGKGSVQDYRQLSDGSAVKITTAQWYTPNGRTINKTGIEPDYNISYSIEQYKDGLDPQKDAATSLILGTKKVVSEQVEETDKTN
jgi:carboxyl-terminal processing protease